MAPRLSGSRDKFGLGQRSTINVTPLIGVMLLLLLVVMTTAPPPPKAITINNPPGHWFGPSPPSNPDVFINLEQGGKLYIGVRPTSLDALVKDVGALTGDPRATEQYVFIRANRFVPYSDFMGAISALKAAGYEVGMIAEDL